MLLKQHELLSDANFKYFEYMHRCFSVGHRLMYSTAASKAADYRHATVLLSFSGYN